MALQASVISDVTALSIPRSLPRASHPSAACGSRQQSVHQSAVIHLHTGCQTLTHWTDSQERNQAQHGTPLRPALRLVVHIRTASLPHGQEVPAAMAQQKNDAARRAATTRRQGMKKGISTKGRKQGHKSKHHWHWPTHTAAAMAQLHTFSHEAHPCWRECIIPSDANSDMCSLSLLCSETLPTTRRSHRQTNQQTLLTPPNTAALLHRHSTLLHYDSHHTQQGSACCRRCWHAWPV
jgi:hypothetical protein